ncbi:MAG: ABC transporter substrate-binding protein, partial [Pseudothermotoga sp.]|nr:ABC transporter substrate-binding protein [Pseudothermotoga sp.]
MRVRLLVVCVLALIVSWAFAWGVYATPADMEKQTGKKITQYKESPMLADLVKQGKLPPVQERLPEE